MFCCVTLKWSVLIPNNPLKTKVLYSLSSLISLFNPLSHRTDTGHVKIGVQFKEAGHSRKQVSFLKKRPENLRFIERLATPKTEPASSFETLVCTLETTPLHKPERYTNYHTTNKCTNCISFIFKSLF